MTQTATRKPASSGSRKGASAAKKSKPTPKKGKPAGLNGKGTSNGKASSNGKAKAKPKAPKKSLKTEAGGAAAKTALTTRPGGPVRAKAAGAALKAVARRAKESLPVLADGSRGALDMLRDADWERWAEKVRTVPVQCSLDVAVPLEAAWDEWMRFDWMPDGAHKVIDVERDGDFLDGELSGRASGEWEAEIVDEREDESFAWQTLQGSDTSGLVTFHRLSDRLTRIELQLDIVPERPGQALSLVLRRADRRAENVMRSFKAQVEALDPDEYPPLAEVDHDDNDDKDE